MGNDLINPRKTIRNRKGDKILNQKNKGLLFRTMTTSHLTKSSPSLRLWSPEPLSLSLSPTVHKIKRRLVENSLFYTIVFFLSFRFNLINLFKQGIVNFIRKKIKTRGRLTTLKLIRTMRGAVAKKKER